jgi:hypothetical protein
MHELAPERPNFMTLVLLGTARHMKRYGTQ